MIPFGVLERAAEALEGSIVEVLPVGGGCINHVSIVKTDRGTQGFLKWNPDAPEGFFEAERRGLEILRRGAQALQGRGLRIPRTLALGHDPSPWLLLEYVPPGPETTGYWRALGTGLARLHRSPPPQLDPEANFLGSLVQENPVVDSWPEFWVSHRLLPQLESAYRKGHFRGAARDAWERLLVSLGDVLPHLPAKERSLLHGDLWSGNVYPDRDGRPVLVDPAVYTGDPLVDLAMTRLFGGFGTDFYEAYGAAASPGFVLSEILVNAYQLYPLLAHVNLFGSGYEGGAMERVRRLLRRL